MQSAAQTRSFVVQATFTSPKQLPVRKLRAENQSKQTLRGERTRGFGCTDLNTISAQPPGLDKAQIKAALAAGSLQRKCLVGSKAKGREKSHAWPSCRVSLQSWLGSQKRKKQAVVQQTY